MQISTFAFQNNISSQVLKKLLKIDSKVLINEDKNTEPQVDQILENKTDLVLGLGMYSGIDKDKIRIENNCTNRFRNEYIKHPNKIKHELFVPKFDLKFFKIASGIGNSYCNLVSFLIMDRLTKSKLKTKYIFLHIPKSFDVELAAHGIQELINNLGV